MSQACCTGWSDFRERPSMVVIFLPATADSGVLQDLVGVPSICTVHAPQSPTPQPNLVPVKPSLSRSTQRSGMSGPAWTSRLLPLTTSVLIFPSPDEVWPGQEGPREV